MGKKKVAAHEDKDQSLSEDQEQGSSQEMTQSTTITAVLPSENQIPQFDGKEVEPWKFRMKLHFRKRNCYK